MTSNEPTPSSDRLDAEISLLEAMYPDTVTFNKKTLELTYRIKAPANADTSTGGTLTLRLPRTYPDHGVPELISACDNTRTDMREATRRAISELNLHEGVEVLDQIVATFDEAVSSSDCTSEISGPRIDSSAKSMNRACSNDNDMDGSGPSQTQFGVGTQQIQRGGVKLRPSKTVIIWLHHLLATSKRKLAVSPQLLNSDSNSNSSRQQPQKDLELKSTTKIITTTTTTTTTISGMTKPGYPGILLFSGPRDLVDAHVRQLKDLNWQAFQKRYDSDEDADGSGMPSKNPSNITTKSKITKQDGDDEDDYDGQWLFTHGRHRIIEVESMADLVKGIVREDHRSTFLRAVGVK